MGCHILCDDGLGRCMAIFVYIIMLIGNGIIVITVVMPAIGEDNQTSMLIEYGCYLFFWIMMVASHMSTMCADPGFISNGYEYKEQVIAAPFQSLAQIESAYSNNNKVDEEDIRPANANESSKNLSLNQSAEKYINLKSKTIAVREKLEQSGLSLKEVKTLQTKIKKKC